MNGDFLEPDFLMIPFQLIKDKELEQVDRLLYGVIYWFEHLRDGRCFAGNEKLASLLGTTTRVVQNSLTNLEKAGYIQRDYKDAAKRNRTEIRSLIAFKLLSPVGDRRKTSDSQVTGVSPTGDRASDLQVTRERIGRDKSKKDTAGDAGGKQIAEIIDLFKDVNPAYRKWFANTTQRAAVSRLLEQHGEERVVKAIGVLSKSNGMPYMPTVTTPAQLEDKWAALSAGFLKKRGEQFTRGRGVEV